MSVKRLNGTGSRVVAPSVPWTTGQDVCEYDNSDGHFCGLRPSDLILITDDSENG